jgi:hypothetical protein
LKQGDALLPLFQLCCRVRHWEGSGKPGWIENKWYTSATGLCFGVNMLGGTVHSVKGTAETSVVASKEIGLDVASAWSCLETSMQDKITT